MDAALRVCRSAATRKRLSAYPDLRQADDVLTEILPYIVRAAGNFDASRSRFSTFIHGVTTRKIIDLARARGRRRAREAKHVESMPRHVYEPDEVIWDPPAPPAEVFEGEIVGGADGMPPLAEWLSGVYQGAKRTKLPPRIRRGRRGYTAAQAVACGLLVKRLRETSRGAVYLFRDRPDLLAAVGIRVIPSHRWFQLARAAGDIFMSGL